MDKEDLITEFIPENLRSSFVIEDFQKHKQSWQLTLIEKKHLLPAELKGKDAVLNGCMNSVEIIDFPFQGKLMHLQFYRRRWKLAGEQASYHNSYIFHRPGMKTTNAFGDFLKGLDRTELTEFLDVWPATGDFWQENL